MKVRAHPHLSKFSASAVRRVPIESRLNLVERRFAGITRQRIRRGVLHYVMELEGTLGSMAMTEIQDVTGTAFVVAEYRARENAEANPLYVDRIVPLFLDERTRQASDGISAGFLAVAKIVRLRTRYFDDEQLSLGCRQVVILGAGLDTRAVRKQAPGVGRIRWIPLVGTLDF